MKRFVLFAGILGSAVCMLGAIPTDAPATTQTLCTDLTALPYNPSTMPAATTFKLYLGRIMSTYAPVADPNAPNNLCSPLSYVIDSCAGTEFYVKINEDGSKVIKMAAYNKVTNNVMCYTQSAELQEEKYHIFKALINKMALIDDKGEITEISSIPQPIQDIENTMIVTLKYAKDMSYAVYSSCSKDAVWVAYSERVIKENLCDTLKEEIDQCLTDLGFDPSKFVDVPTTIPISLDNCFVGNEVPATA